MGRLQRRLVKRAGGKAGAGPPPRPAAALRARHAAIVIPDRRIGGRPRRWRSSGWQVRPSPPCCSRQSGRHTCARDSDFQQPFLGLKKYLPSKSRVVNVSGALETVPGGCNCEGGIAACTRAPRLRCAGPGVGVGLSPRARARRGSG